MLGENILLDYRFKRVADNRLIWAQDFISDAHHKWNEILQYSNLSEQMRELMLHSMVKSGVFIAVLLMMPLLMISLIWVI